MGVVQKAINVMNSRLAKESDNKGALQQSNDAPSGDSMLMVHFVTIADPETHESTVTSNKTYAEIVSALSENKLVYGVIEEETSGTYCYLTSLIRRPNQSNTGHYVSFTGTVLTPEPAAPVLLYCVTVYDTDISTLNVKILKTDIIV